MQKPDVTPFLSHPDYRQLAEAFFLMAILYLGKDDAPVKELHTINLNGVRYNPLFTPAYAEEMIHVLNNPEADVEQVLALQRACFEHYADGKYDKVERPTVELLIKVVNALRHTVKPAHCSY